MTPHPDTLFDVGHGRDRDRRRSAAQERLAHSAFRARRRSRLAGVLRATADRLDRGA